MIAGVSVAIWLLGCDSERNRVLGNFIGLSPDGEEAVGCDWGVLVGGGRGNVIGGRSPAAANVIAHTQWGAVRFSGGVGSENRIEGNYLGMDPTGTRPLPQALGVVIGYEVTRRQIIGGDVPAAGNFIASGIGVMAENPGRGSLIWHNTFGAGPTGQELGIDVGVECHGSSPRVAENLFAVAAIGLAAHRRQSTPVVTGNEFRRCRNAIQIAKGAAPDLGDLNNASPEDNGRNVFSTANDYYVVNHSVRGIRAEGNGFGTTVVAEIAAKIIDHEDNPAYGEVDFLPLLGATGPASPAAGSPLLVSAACQPTGTEAAEVTVVLAAAAKVSIEVVNVAGRHVRWVAREVPVGAGLNRLAWDRRSDRGLVAPAGRYIIRVTARVPDGSQAQLLAPVMLR